MSLGHTRVLEVLIPWEGQTFPAAVRGTLQPHVNHVSGQLLGSPKSSYSRLGSLVAVMLCYRFDWIISFLGVGSLGVGESKLLARIQNMAINRLKVSCFTRLCAQLIIIGIVIISSPSWRGRHSFESWSALSSPPHSISLGWGRNELQSLGIAWNSCYLGSYKKPE